ncbi:Stk1 family PASTA domain-containing Ser/Thr kinase [Halalkalibacter hemicellulosilyticus]|uniref:Serine/threonine-protein kinase PrkC n=1 Tax=Halalkalibacter hemicellulosilyticusJCM 9152 TaxID=1236971 RepID=W4QB53_9BACI|nr:Stk1 family PASTA domain-containing Ser/Thr kinase [Halalkalibacter hemicellulosilyticus]GAE29197.1 serine/threonine protein kinase PrkC [Halalkalibacter hemicellulosilyticusJCM 9152]
MNGQRISGRYHILEKIGGGGMANVYKAHDVILDREVAVKVLQPQFSSDEQFIHRFRREAQAATSLNHPNIVNIYDVGEEDDTYYIVMEYVEGQTLKELIQMKGALDVEEAVGYMEQMLSALSHSHANQLVHRDIKPHNILVRHDGLLKVTDFGIARAISAATITHTNSVMGSVQYLSPEQARGGQVTFKSDIYSLGIVFYEMVTGRIPFSGDTAVSIAIKHLQHDTPSIKDLNEQLPQSIDNMIKRATEKDPLKRYDSIQDMEEDLSTVLHPSRLEEEPYNQAVDEEATKVIPVIKDEDLEKTIEAPVEKEKEQTEEETTPPPNKKKRKKNKKLIILLTVIAILLGSIIIAFTVIPRLLHVNEVEVPDFTEIPFEDAEEELIELKLIAEREDVYHESVPNEHVVRQNPLPGSMVKEQAPITLFVSLGQEEMEIDDYIGTNIDRAEALLESQGFTVKRDARETNEEEPGIVLEQDPSGGDMVVPAETTVTLTYSVEAPIRLQNLVGLEESAVKDYFAEVDLNGDFVEEYSSSVEEGRVIRQDPGAFTMLSKGDDVIVVISQGPEPEPEPEVEPSKFFSQNYRIVVEDENGNNSYRIKIVYRDASTKGEDRVYVEEQISETVTYRIQLEVSSSYPGSYDVYVDEELVEQSDVFHYDD